jgi:hypothetical protein
MNIKTLDLYASLPPSRDTLFAPMQAHRESPGLGLDIESTRKVALAVATCISNA